MIIPGLRTQVLVVGAGIVGTILALELARYGVASVVVERSAVPPRNNDSNTLGSRTIEVLRRLGLAAKVQQHTVGKGRPNRTIWSRRLDEPPVLVARDPSDQIERGQQHAIAAAGHSSSEVAIRVPNANLVEQLRDAARAHPLIDLRQGWTFADLRLRAEDATATMLHGRTRERRTIEARFVAGCDGAQSTVRRCLDVSMEVLREPAQHVSVYFRSDDPHLRPDGPATMVVGDRTILNRREDGDWVGHVRIDRNEQPATDPIGMLRSYLGIPLHQPVVQDVRQWDDSLPIAARYQRGPAYLVGESAHRFHPVEATVDTSVSDAVDLAWKLAAVIDGWGGPVLLSTYETERRQGALVARQLLARDLERHREFGRLAAAGVARDVLAKVLQQERFDCAELDPALLNRCMKSPIIWREPGAASTRRPDGETPPIEPGDPAPSVDLADGTPLFDHFGPHFTLVDLTHDASGGSVLDAARRRGIPVTHLPITDSAVRTRWNHRLVLLRPDRRVAWRGDRPPEDWLSILDVVSGQKTT